MNLDGPARFDDQWIKAVAFGFLESLDSSDRVISREVCYLVSPCIYTSFIKPFLNYCDLYATSQYLRIILIILYFH